MTAANGPPTPHTDTYTYSDIYGHRRTRARRERSTKAAVPAQPPRLTQPGCCFQFPSHLDNNGVSCSAHALARAHLQKLISGGIRYDRARLMAHLLGEQGGATLTGRRGAAASVLPSEATEVCSSSSTTTSTRTRRVLQLLGEKSAAALRVHSAGQKDGRVPTPGPLVPLLPLLPPLQRGVCLGSMAQPVSPASNGASVVKVIRSTRPGGQTPMSVVHAAAGGGGLRPKE